MSETDDTDLLISIPSNFFSLSSSDSKESLLNSAKTVLQRPPSCTAHVIGKLVNKLHCIEGRLENLELSSDTISSQTIQCKSYDFDKSLDSERILSSTFPRRRRRKTPSSRYLRKNISITSLDSVSTFRKYSSLPFSSNTSKSNQYTTIDDSISMDGDLSSIVSSPNKKTDKLLLNEVEEFLNKVESYEQDRTLKSDDPDTNPRNIIKATSEYITQKIENTEDRQLPSTSNQNTYLQKFIYLAEKNPESDQLDGNVKMSRDNNQEDTLTNKSPSSRKLNFREQKDIQTTSTPKKNIETRYQFKPPSNKLYEKTSQVLEQYRQNYSNSSIDTNCIITPKKELKFPKMKLKDFSRMQSKYLDSIDTDLLSLSELWIDKKETSDKKADSIKLEEERMKREHCEALIQDLQKKLLDQQERLAVAIKVDKSKDAAIMKLKEAWLRLTSGIDNNEEKHKHDMDKYCKEIEHLKVVAEDANKKCHHFETELYKALDLAHDYQEKCRHMSNLHVEMQQNMEKVLSERDNIIMNRDKEINMLKDNYETVTLMNKQSTECVKGIEEALEKEKQEHENTKLKLNDIQMKIKFSETEIGLLKEESICLKEQLGEAQSKYNVLEKQLSDKHNHNCELIKRCESQENEIKSLHAQLEVQKCDLKAHYQRQLEDAVVSKLQEFQQQLEQAENDIELEHKRKENVIVETFQKEVHNLEQQHKLEINVLEEKHKEEIKLYRVQYAQEKERNNILENKLSSYRDRRGQIAEQLHTVMENQWRQALNILTNTNTNMQVRSDNESTQDLDDYSKIQPLSLPSSNRIITSQRRMRNDNVQDVESLNTTDFQDYIKKLLTKVSTNKHEGSGDMFDNSAIDIAIKDLNEEPTSDRPDKERRDKKRSLGKPPWKA